jgi:hypothetical protein
MNDARPKSYDSRTPREIVLDRGALAVTLVLYVALPALVVAVFAALVAGRAGFVAVVVLAVVAAAVVWRIRSTVRDDGSHMREQGLVRLEELPEKCGLCGKPLADIWTAVACEDCGLWYPPAEDDLCGECRRRIAAEVEEDLEAR